MVKHPDHLPFATHALGEEERDEVLEVLASNWLTTGPRTQQFEQDFSAYIGCDHALAVNSCTAGLHLALEAIGVGPGDRVITTPYTFTATAEVIRYLGADPLFVDIDPKTLNIDPALIEEALDKHGSKVKAVMPVHFAGQACDMDPILEMAHAHDCRVVEDAAHALPTTYKGKQVGAIGDLTAYSFYATKTITTGEGGMVTTNNPDYAKRISTMRLHGIDRDVFDRYQSKKPAWYYEVVAPGFKYNMPDILAALGINQLKKADRFQARRQAIAEIYNRELVELPLARPYVARPEDQHAWHLYVIQLELGSIKMDRDQFIERMAELGVGLSVHFIPLHLHPYWRERYGFTPIDFPTAYEVFHQVVSLPIHPRMSDDDAMRVVASIKKVLGA
uniref:Putative aminotransferase n=1 Tax=Magnetococcus massalia (strain MO-1) TaxID=451514 RepID=A0A1S7LL86_MAGMO|nr:putative aminotransferase [Candidatus Magnetococcus massalia]